MEVGPARRHDDMLGLQRVGGHRDDNPAIDAEIEWARRRQRDGDVWLADRRRGALRNGRDFGGGRWRHIKIIQIRINMNITQILLEEPVLGIPKVNP